MTRKQWFKKTEQACWKAVEHWYENWGDLYMAEVGPGACALCRSFLNNTVRAFPDYGCCEGCPVMEDTGLDNCVGTPWKEANIALSTYKSAVIRGSETSLELLEYQTKQAFELEYAYLVEIALKYGERRGKR